MNEFTSILNEKTCLAEIQKYFKFQVPTTCFQSSRSIAEREDPQAVTVTAAARSAASQRGLRGPVCEHRGSQHAARSEALIAARSSAEPARSAGGVWQSACTEPKSGASTKRWRSAGEANAKRWRSQLVRAGSALASARSAARAEHSIPLHGARRI